MQISHMAIKRTFLVVIFFFVTVYAASAQTFGGGEANPRLLTNKESLKKWQDMRFGMFIHWGPVTLRGTEIGWSRGPQVPIEEYDNLYKEFNPLLFNAGEWVSAAKNAGMKYLVITSKHHDGFCLWESKYTEYDIMSTPFRRDVLRELSDECARQGIMFCTYYSILDWHHPQYTTRYGGDTRLVENSDMNLYKVYLKNQIEELVINYQTNMLWFDGQWEKSWTHDDGMDLYSYGRSLNDRLLINNRVDKGPGEGNGTTDPGKFAGDFGTPEQEIGEFDNQHPWESCITIGSQWSWKPNDKIKSLRECISILAKTAGGGGNLLFNISPMPDGRIEQRQMESLKAIGNWLGKYGESIYGTGGGPFKPTSWMASTHKNNRIYVHLLMCPKDELRLPKLPNRKIKSARLFNSKNLEMKTVGNQVLIRLPAEMMDQYDNVIILELDGPAETIEPLDVPKNIFDELEASNILLKTSPIPKYSANGIQSLIDKTRGTASYLDGTWLGFEQDDFEAIIDLQTIKPVNKIIIGCLQAQIQWIFYPKSIEVAVSENGKDFKVVGMQNLGDPKQNENPSTKDFIVKLDSIKTKYVRIIVKNMGICPDWHSGAGGKAWLFVDEIIVD